MEPALVFDRFLSHLCGEEERFFASIRISRFLSHLCGEEVQSTVNYAPTVFLSHLCGEEAPPPFLTFRYLLSKSPMR